MVPSHHWFFSTAGGMGNSNCGIQETGFPPGRETQHNIQHYLPLA